MNMDPLALNMDTIVDDHCYSLIHKHNQQPIIATTTTTTTDGQSAEAPVSIPLKKCTVDVRKLTAAETSRITINPFLVVNRCARCTGKLYYGPKCGVCHKLYHYHCCKIKETCCSRKILGGGEPPTKTCPACSASVIFGPQCRRCHSVFHAQCTNAYYRCCSQTLKSPDLRRECGKCDCVVLTGPTCVWCKQSYHNQCATECCGKPLNDGDSMHLVCLKCKRSLKNPAPMCMRCGYASHISCFKKAKNSCCGHRILPEFFYTAGGPAAEIETGAQKKGERVIAVPKNSSDAAASKKKTESKSPEKMTNHSNNSSASRKRTNSGNSRSRSESTDQQSTSAGPPPERDPLETGPVNFRIISDDIIRQAVTSSAGPNTSEIPPTTNSDRNYEKSTSSTTNSTATTSVPISIKQEPMDQDNNNANTINDDSSVATATSREQGRLLDLLLEWDNTHQDSSSPSIDGGNGSSAEQHSKSDITSKSNKNDKGSATSSKAVSSLEKNPLLNLLLNGNNDGGDEDQQNGSSQLEPPVLTNNACLSPSSTRPRHSIDLNPPLLEPQIFDLLMLKKKCQEVIGRMPSPQNPPAKSQKTNDRNHTNNNRNHSNNNSNRSNSNSNRSSNSKNNKTSHGSSSSSSSRGGSSNVVKSKSRSSEGVQKTTLFKRPHKKTNSKSNNAAQKFKETAKRVVTLKRAKDGKFLKRNPIESQNRSPVKCFATSLGASTSNSGKKSHKKGANNNNSNNDRRNRNNNNKRSVSTRSGSSSTPKTEKSQNAADKPRTPSEAGLARNPAHVAANRNNSSSSPRKSTSTTPAKNPTSSKTTTTSGGTSSSTKRLSKNPQTEQQPVYSVDSIRIVEVKSESDLNASFSPIATANNISNNHSNSSPLVNNSNEASPRTLRSQSSFPATASCSTGGATTFAGTSESDSGMGSLIQSLPGSENDIADGDGQPPDTLETYFYYLYNTVRKFPHHVQTQVKAHLFGFVTDVELKLHNNELS